jgi:hypothetical protein
LDAARFGTSVPIETLLEPLALSNAIEFPIIILFEAPVTPLPAS